MLFLGCAILAFNLIVFLVLIYFENRGKNIVITPFILFGSFSIITTWAAPIYLYYTGFLHDTYALFIVSLSFQAFLLGFLFCLRRRNLPREFFDSNLTLGQCENYFLFGILLSSAVLFYIGLYYYQGIPPATQVILGLVSDSDMAGGFLAQHRFEVTKSHWFGGTYRGQGLLKAILQIGWPYVLSVSILLYYKTRKKFFGLLSVLLFLLTFSFITGTGERMPIIKVIIYFIILFSMVYKIKIRLILSVAAVSYLLLVWMTSWYGGSKAGNLLVRIFMGDGSNNVHIIDLVQSGVLGFQYGLKHLEKIVSSIPGIQYGDPLSLELSRLLDYNPVTFASGTYLGLVYIDFSLIGVIALFFFMGAALGHIQPLLFGREKRILDLILVSMTVFYLGQMYASGPRGFAVAFIIVLLFHFFFKMLGSLYSVFLYQAVLPKLSR